MSKSKLDPITSVKEINSQSWQYVLYEVNEQYWVMFIPYSPKSYVDTSVGILLSAEERANAERDNQWLLHFARNVRKDYQNYLPRALKSEIMAALRQHL